MGAAVATFIAIVSMWVMYPVVVVVVIFFTIIICCSYFIIIIVVVGKTC